MNEYLKNIITSDLILLDKASSFLDKDKNLWDLIASIPDFFIDCKSSEISIDNVIINESKGPVIIDDNATV